MDYLSRIEQHIINGKDEQFILNCLQAVEAKFLEAVENNLPHIVQFMIEHGADVHAYDDRALILSSLRGHAEVVRLLLEGGADVHARDEFALIYSSENFHIEVVRLLLEGGAKPASVIAGLRWSDDKGYTEIVELLKKYMTTPTNKIP